MPIEAAYQMCYLSTVSFKGQFIKNIQKPFVQKNFGLRSEQLFEARPRLECYLSVTNIQ